MGPAVGRRDANALLRRLPSVDELLRSPLGQELLDRAPRWAVVSAARSEVDRLREMLLSSRQEEPPTPTPDAARMRAAVDELLRPSLIRVINATGVVLHTNLGRAPLHP